MKTLLLALVILVTSATAGDKQTKKPQAVQYSIAKIDSILTILVQQKQRLQDQYVFESLKLEGQIEMLRAIRRDTTAFVKPGGGTE